MIRNIFTAGLLFIHILTSAQALHVGVFGDHPLEKSVVYCTSGSFNLLADDRSLCLMEPADMLYLIYEEEGIRVLDAESDYGHAAQVELRALTGDAVFSLRPISPELDIRTYDDDLQVSTKQGSLVFVNRVDMDKYVAGVIQAEAGVDAHIEFYKAQAVLCRTHALKNNQRHLEEGYSLCDKSHCQAYHGRSDLNPEILEAVLETTGVIAADFNFKLIDAVYHTNSGGQTQRASDVWSVEADYLQAVVDPYSLHQPHAKWTDTIPFPAWKDYLRENGMLSVDRIPEEIIYVEQMRRKKDFVLDRDSLRMTKIREDWGFHSTFFDMFPEGDSVLVWGKGYGHGVGLSQEGAKKMARDEFSYPDILQFYFFDIRLMDYRDLPASSLSQTPFQ